ncbi:ATP-binding protein [Pseudomonas migulae]|uniref:histidine kinase n=1 Tax=Pseudomonas migulae TaxID=78543 RepID=A0A1H4ZP62_9PSED|nr:ATP-binding protein [Pseudomonas migulae]SED31254.1 PAS domain S-box-containing protein [Pseudomonas migulae]
MSSGDKLFGRLLNRHPPPPEIPSALSMTGVGLQMHLDAEGRVIHLAGPLRHGLAQQHPAAQAPLLQDFLMPHSSLAITGSPADWQGQSLDLDFYSLSGQPLHLRGWVQPMADAWLLQLLDIGDLLQERRQARSREQCQLLATRIGDQLRLCSLSRLPEVLVEQLQHLAQRFQIPCLAVALLDEQEDGWQIHQHYAALDAPRLWQNGQRLGTGLDSLNGSAPQYLTHGEHPRLHSIFGSTEGFAVPYHDAQGVVAWLLCGFYPAQQRAPDVAERDWLQLAAALAGPLLERLREHQHHLQLERLESLQTLLGSGWWEMFSDSAEVQLAWSLASTLNLTATRMSLHDWLEHIHPADREALSSRLQDLQDEGTPLLLCVRLHHPETPTWYRLQGQAMGVGKDRRLVGFMLDISDIKNQQQDAAAAHARLNNLIAHSPAVIYVQRYVEGALLPTFFSDSLLQLLGWTLADCTVGALAERVHPEDRERYFERTRQLLREGSVRARYRLRDSRGDYHWLLDEARLVRDDLGLPVEAFGLWLDVTDATLAAEEQLAQSAKMATLGEMATGLAHEITQRLNVMRMAIVSVLKRLNNGEVQVDYLTDTLNRIDTQVQRAARVVDHMRVFGRRSEVEQHPFNPFDAIEGTLSLLAEGLRGTGVELRVGESRFEVKVRGHVDQLEQVLINLMVNARDALMSKRGADHDFKPWISVHAERDEHSVRLWVEDNGGGIDPRLLERIFEPFFTTKPVGAGTGLGLSVSHDIVEKMNGTLRVSNSGEGARFCIELPIVVDDQIIRLV